MLEVTKVTEKKLCKKYEKFVRSAKTVLDLDLSNMICFSPSSFKSCKKS